MQQLPAKDQAVFRSIVKFYETKQYKKGVKAADSILKKHPDHGETLCMKGLTLSYLERKEEAYELVRKGLKNDMKSHVCWHVFGLLYRADRDYKQAVNCYKQALKIDADNMQILRDLSLLQIHRRDLAGFAETRRKLLQVKPGNRLNWVGYAIAEHLCKSFEFAWTCLDNYEKTFKDESVPEYENSEMFLYKASIMEEAGKFEEALDCLKQHEKEIVDKNGFFEAKSRLCMFLGRFDEAAEIYRSLIRTNQENHLYVLGYMACQTKFHRFWPPLPPPKAAAQTPEDEEAADVPLTICSFPQSQHPEAMPIWGWLPPQHSLRSDRRMAIGARQHKKRLDSYQPLVDLTEEEEDAVLEFFDGLISDHPRSDTLERLSLYFLFGERFLRRCDAYLRKRLRKGIPSLFRMIRPLYFSPGKAKHIESLLMQYVKHLQEEIAWFGPEAGKDAAPPQSPDFDSEEPPSCLLFAFLVTAEHYDFIGQTATALEYADKAIAHTPTFVEIYSSKARIYKHAGDLESSAKCFDEVRQMDLADRFLNTQAVRALLRVDEVKTGMEKALLFSKEPDAPEAANLHDMQCMWYECAVGRSYTRQKNYGKALKKFSETFKHFNDIAEDQFDFHNYCLRKTTLKTYVAMLRMQERLYSHKFYRRAAKDAIKIYLELFDMKERGEGPTKKASEVDPEAELSAEEKRRLKHQKKRAGKKEDQEKAKQAAASGGKPKKIDDDPEGEKLLEKDPMEEACKLVKVLTQYCWQEPATQVLVYDCMSRQGKLIHCLQAFVRLWELTGKNLTNYKIIAPLAHFCFVAKIDEPRINSAVQEVIFTELAPVLAPELKGKPFGSVKELRSSASKVVDQVEKRLKEKKDLPLAEVLYSLKCLGHAGRDTVGFLETWRPEGAFSLKECKKMLDYLAAEHKPDSKIYCRFKDRCLEIFPLMKIS
jgi:peptide alpha-N-acetyltransferase